MVDFSFPKDEIEKAINEADSVLILDHHESAKQNLSPFMFAEPWSEAKAAWELAKIEGGGVCLFDMERSGARLAWDFFFPGQDVPNLINYIQDRDLWQHKLPHSKDINQWVMSFDHSFSSFDYLDVILSDDADFSGACS